MAFKEKLLSRGAAPIFADKMGRVLDTVAEKGHYFAIISVYRSASKQAALLGRWQKGDRSGLRAKPARMSRHSITKDGKPFACAVDIAAQSDVLALIGGYAKADGLRWGGNFQSKDEVHFDMDPVEAGA